MKNQPENCFSDGMHALLVGPQELSALDKDGIDPVRFYVKLGRFCDFLLLKHVYKTRKKDRLAYIHQAPPRTRPLNVATGILPAQFLFFSSSLVGPPKMENLPVTVVHTLYPTP